MKLYQKAATIALIVMVSLSLATPAFAQSCGADGKGVKVSSALGVKNNCVGGAENPIYDLVRVVVQFTVGIFGLLLVLMITYAGFQYIISQGDPNNTKAAKQRIEQAITGLIIFVLMYAILNALIPGGVF